MKGPATLKNELKLYIEVVAERWKWDTGMTIILLVLFYGCSMTFLVLQVYRMDKKKVEARICG